MSKFDMRELIAENKSLKAELERENEALHRMEELYNKLFDLTFSIYPNIDDFEEAKTEFIRGLDD